MRSLVNALLGYVVVRAQGAFPERLLNLCAGERLTFWALEWQDSFSFSLCLRASDLKKLRALAERLGCTLTVERRRGLPAFLLRFRRRCGFLAGLALSLLAVGLGSNIVFTVQVSGNHAVPTAEILSVLRRYGLRPGVYGPGLELRELSQRALLDLDGLSWLGVNLNGTRAEVIVREALEPPELTQREGCWDIVAARDGLVTAVEALEGQARVREGDVVLRGDVLISGTVVMEPPQYSDLPPRAYQTQARGSVRAATWRSLSAQIPLEAEVKRFTGEEQRRVSLTLFSRRINILQNSSISLPAYDKITEVYVLRLPGGPALPLRLRVERCRAYTTERVPVDRDAAQDLLERRLVETLEALLGEEGELRRADFTARVSGGVLTVTLEAECSEEIGRGVLVSPQRTEG